MSKDRESSAGMPVTDVPKHEAPRVALEFHGVRYQVKDVAQSVAFAR
jgi:hypothetical protein